MNQDTYIDVPSEPQPQSPSQALTVRDAVQAVERAATPEKPTKTAQEMRVVEVSEALLPAYQKMGTLELTDKECDDLMSLFPDEVVEVRPHDGLLYIPHIHVSDRLNRIFKPGKWALVRRREWFDADSNTMFGEYVLVIRGCFVGESVGGHPYAKNNPKINYSDVLESTAAEALRRICGKRLSCGSQVWNPEYCRQWESKHRGYANGKYFKKPASGAPPPAAPAQRMEHPRNQAPPAPQRQQSAAPDGEQVFPVCDVLMVAKKPGSKQRTDKQGNPMVDANGQPVIRHWNTYFIKFNDGYGEFEAITFDDKFGDIAIAADAEQSKVKLVTKPGKKAGSREIVSLERAEAPPATPSSDQVPMNFDEHGNPLPEVTP